MERALSKQLTQIGILLATMYVVYVVTIVTGRWPTQFGIVPRTAEGLQGIVFSPLLHGSWSHLFANTIPLAVMLGLLSFSKRHSLWPTTAAIWVLTGIGIWLVGRPDSLQLGASGLVFGLAAFLIASAWISRHLRSAFAALVVIFLYGGIVWGLLPGTRGVSWEGHLCGVIAGIALANVLERRKR